jgi:hypothetical protein
MSAPYKFGAVANGLRTNHPIPDLPFVDDSHIPIDDKDAVEAIGRTKGREHGMRGREDVIREDESWLAFTTDPVRPDLAWIVRWHPEHGSSVVLYRDADAASAYMTYWGQPLLFRAGGYWWDGVTWYRPLQVFDSASEEYVTRAVPSAATTTAADLLVARTDPAAAAVLSIIDVDVDAEFAGRWVDHLALWAAHREEGTDLSRCVVGVSAHELGADQLVGAAVMGEIAGVAASTFRAYLARGEATIPLPQATISGRAMWSRPVAEEWAESRRHSGDGAAAAISGDPDDLAPGVQDLWDRWTDTFRSLLWDNPDRRRRWALRWRTRSAVDEVATYLGWIVAASVDRIVPIEQLAFTLEKALLHEIEEGRRMIPDERHDFGVNFRIARLLDWLIRHDPRSARAVVAGVIGEAERQYGTPRMLLVRTLHTALNLDGKLTEPEYREFFQAAVTGVEW